MKSRTRRSLARPLVVALAVAALAAPVAQAHIPDPDNKPTSVSHSVAPDGWQRHFIASDTGRDSQSIPPDPWQRNIVAGELGSPDAKPPTVPTGSSDGFDFGDAAVGFGIAAGLALLATGVAVAIRRRHGGTLAGA